MNAYSINNSLVTKEDIQDHEAVAAVIWKGDFIVLLKHIKYGWWTIPIGKVKQGQTVEEALRTELQEEMGITPVWFFKVGEFEKTYDRDNGIRTKIKQHIFVIDKYIGTIENKEPNKHQYLIWSLCPGGIKDLHISDATLFYLNNMRR